MQDGRAPRVKNRAPAAIQITAEQILREAQERQEPSFKAPRQRVEDYEELHEYRGRKRKEFEERIRRTRGNLKEWLQYASWEASQGEYDRARSVYERALDVDPRAIPLWLAYTETELKSRNVQHARNLYDRAVTLLPRVDQLWYKFVYLEELLQNVAGARQIFERWMAWEPDDKAWQAYVKMEERYQEHDRASAIYERWIAVRPEPRIWVKWAKFEEDRGRLDKAREVFQTALEFFGDDPEQVEKAQAVYSAFARMEVRAKEYERARVVYRFAISRLPRSKSAGLYEAFTKFEKQHGQRPDLEATVLNKRRLIYEDEVKEDGRNYDAWVDYARLEEYALQSAKDEGASAEEEEQCIERVREVYERAIAQIPPGGEKRHWRRYIFLWIFYALFEELVTQDFERARRVYNTAITVIPHKTFTFAKLWLMFAKFEIRSLDLPAARKILGRSIGMCPKPALFKGYIQLEIELREFDRVRTLYEKYLEYDPMNSSAWVQFAELERQLGDDTRARAIYELGISQTLSMPEVLWKSYIDFEFEEGERERCRALYDRLVGVSGHVRVWLAYASFEMARIPVKSDGEEEEAEGKYAPGDSSKAREVYRKAYEHMRSQNLKDERLVILKVWRTFEEEHGTESDVEKVQAMMPTVVERLKTDEFGNQVAYSDYLYPDDERAANPATFKFLEMARAWKKSGGEALSQTAPQRAKRTDEGEESGQSSGEE